MQKACSEENDATSSDGDSSSVDTKDGNDSDKNDNNDTSSKNSPSCSLSFADTSGSLMLFSCLALAKLPWYLRRRRAFRLDRIHALWFACAWFFCACESKIEVRDEGHFCVRGLPVDDSLDGAPLYVFEEGKAAEVEVILAIDNSGCAKDIKAKCEVTREASGLVLHASGSYTVERGDGNCPAVLLPIVAKCVTPPLIAGTERLTYTRLNETFDVPSTQPVIASAPDLCVEEVKR